MSKQHTPRGRKRQHDDEATYVPISVDLVEETAPLYLKVALGERAYSRAADKPSHAYFPASQVQGPHQYEAGDADVTVYVTQWFADKVGLTPQY